MIALAPGDSLRLRGFATGDVYGVVREVRQLALDGAGAALVVDVTGVAMLIEGTVSGPCWGARHDGYELAVTSCRPWPPRRARAPRRRRGETGIWSTAAGITGGTEDIDGRR